MQRRRSKATGVEFDIVRFPDGSILAVITEGQPLAGRAVKIREDEVEELFWPEVTDA